MDNKSKFLLFIANEYSIDYWSDVAIEQAIKLANEMSESDWASLRDVWMKLAPIVQQRIAEVAGETSLWTDHIGEMLIAMLSSPSVDVIEASVDSLNSIVQSDSSRLRNLSIDEALKSVIPNDPVVARVLNSLKQRLRVSY